MRGFYKVEFEVNGTAGRSVMYAHGGSMLGGNSAFAHLGSYREENGEVACEVITRRHNFDPRYVAMAGPDDATLLARGRATGDVYRFQGTLAEVPGSVFRSVMTPLDEEIGSESIPLGDGAIVNGLYSIHIQLLDGIEGGNTGVMLLHDGRMLGGDAFFYYLGSYTCTNGRWKGQFLNQEHTSAKGHPSLFGGHEVGIGFSGRYSEEAASFEATALAGKRSIRLTAELKLIRRA